MARLWALLMLVSSLFLPSGRVTRIVDGDTLIVNKTRKIRILGIDAPEINHCYGRKSQHLLSKLTLGKKIRYQILRKDMYKRTLATAWVGKTLVGEAMLEAGAARPDYTDPKQNQELKRTFQKAKQNKIGLWSGVCVSKTPPKENCVIKGNIEGSTGKRFYHYPSCRHYNQVVLDLDRGEQWFCTEMEALAAGFKRGGGCNNK